MTRCRTARWKIFVKSLGVSRNGGIRRGRSYLALDAVAEFLGVRDHHERFRGASGAVDHDGAVAEHSAHEGFRDADAFHFVEHQVEGSAAGHARFDQDSAVGDGHFGGVSFGRAPGEYDHRDYQEDAAKEHHSAGTDRSFQGGHVAVAVLCGERVDQKREPRNSQEQAEEQRPEEDEPVVARLEEKRLAGDQVFSYITHRILGRLCEILVGG